MTTNDIRKHASSAGFYKDIELGTPAYNEDDIDRRKENLEGVETTNKDEVFTLIRVSR